MCEESGLLKEIYLYLTEGRYPDGCTRERKRTIRRKAEKSITRDGQLFYIYIAKEEKKKVNDRGIAAKDVKTLGVRH